MQWTDRVRQIRMLLVIVAVVIAVVSLSVSHILVDDLSKEERNKMEVWAQALHALSNADENTDLTLVLSVIRGNNTIPVIVMDAGGNVTDYRNVKVNARNEADSMAYISALGHQMYRSGKYIKVDFGGASGKSDYQLVCYDESNMLKRLSSYPYIQLGVVLILSLWLFLHCFHRSVQSRTRCG